MVVLNTASDAVADVRFARVRFTILESGTFADVAHVGVTELDAEAIEEFLVLLLVLFADDVGGTDDDNGEYRPESAKSIVAEAGEERVLVFVLVAVLL